MAGLLDFVSSPEGQGLLSAAFGGLAGARRGAPLNTLGMAGLAGLSGYNHARDRDTEQAQLGKRNQILDLQIAQAQQTQKDAETQRNNEAVFRSSIQSPMQMARDAALGGGGGPTVANAANMPAVDPRTQQLWEAMHTGQIKPMDYITATAKDKTPIKLGAGETLVEPGTYKPLFSAPNKPESTPSAIQEYNLAKQQGYPGTFTQWSLEQKRAGATNVSVSTEKNLLNTLAGGLGKSMTDAQSGAQSALGTIATVQRLTDALDSGKVMAGPGTSFRQYGLQVGNMLGMSGKDAQEKLTNTRAAIQSLAQLELDGAQQMKGQGQITEAERSIIKRAASGDIDSMTVPELRVLGGVLDRSARTKIRAYNAQVKPLMSNPDAAALAPFLSVAEPTQQSAPNVLRFDARGNPVR